MTLKPATDPNGADGLGVKLCTCAGRGGINADGASILRVHGTNWHGGGRCHGWRPCLQGERHGLASGYSNDADAADYFRVKSTNWRGGGGADNEGADSMPVQGMDWSGRGPLTPKAPMSGG